MQKSFGELKEMAKQTLTGKYGPAIRVLLFYYVTSFLAERFLGGSAFLSLLVMLLSNMLYIGVCCYYLVLGCNEVATAENLFTAFMENTGKAFQLSFVYTLISFLTTLPASVFLTLYYNQSQALLSLAPMLYVLQGVLALAWIPLHLYFSQAIFLFLDFPQYDVKTILLLSVQKMKGKKLRFLLFELSFLPLFLLSIPTLGLGLLWLIPYFITAKVHFYLELMHPSSYSSTSDNH